jgi:thiamine-monophosphate kinase
MKLVDVGERHLTEVVLPNVCSAAGDDCGYLTIGTEDLVVTTDPVPQPAAKVIAGDTDPYWAGRLLVTINASDLAAAGAKPLGFVAALECSPTMLVDDLERFIRGVSDGCSREHLQYLGGNLKEANEFAATGTAFGTVPRGTGLHRRGAQSGDLIYSIGNGGEFWRDAFRWRGGERFEKEGSKLFAPGSQLAAMQVLKAQLDIHCSMDNSDGLLATLDQLARINDLEVRLGIANLLVEGVSDIRESAKFWLGWGDWNVIIAIGPSSEKTLGELCVQNNIAARRIAQFVHGEPKVFAEFGGNLKPAPRLESERFAGDSWFIEGIDEYIARLNSVNIL